MTSVRAPVHARPPQYSFCVRRLSRRFHNFVAFQFDAVAFFRLKINLTISIPEQTNFSNVCNGLPFLLTFSAKHIRSNASKMVGHVDAVTKSSNSATGQTVVRSIFVDLFLSFCSCWSQWLQERKCFGTVRRRNGKIAWYVIRSYLLETGTDKKPEKCVQKST